MPLYDEPTTLTNHCVIHYNNNNNNNDNNNNNLNFNNDYLHNYYIQLFKFYKKIVMTVISANAALTLLEQRPEKNSGSEWNSNPQPLRCQYSALPTELSKPHESGRIRVSPYMWMLYLAVIT